MGQDKGQLYPPTQTPLYSPPPISKIKELNHIRLKIETEKCNYLVHYQTCQKHDIRRMSDGVYLSKHFLPKLHAICVIRNPYKKLFTFNLKVDLK